MRHAARHAALPLALTVACVSVTDPPLPRGTLRVAAPAVYARWWAMVESCSGLAGDDAAITWYVVPGTSTIAPGPGHPAPANGYYSHTGRQIVLAGEAQYDGGVVRHEMLHALLRGEAGHRRSQFLGACAGVVRCEHDCVADAGPAPAPPASARVVPAPALTVAATLAPASPSASRDSGWFTLTVTATNVATTPVVVSPPPDGTSLGFAYRLDQATWIGRPPDETGPAELAEPIADASALQFAAGETKRFVFDLRVVTRAAGVRGILPGALVARGAFGALGVGADRSWSAPVAATLLP